MHILSPKVIVISGPSGVGKGTVIKEILRTRPDIGLAISATTRKRRPLETHGLDYYFFDQASFFEKAENNEFLEWCNVHGNCYGTMKEEVRKYTDQKKHVILEIDVQGARKIIEATQQGAFNNEFDVLSIFIEPPTVDDLVSRLKLRNTESDTEQKKRVKNAESELEMKQMYDHAIVNNEKELAASEILGIISKFEKSKIVS